MNKNYDNRIRNLGQIEALLKLLSRVTLLMVVSCAVVLFFSRVTKASSGQDLFWVPSVELTNMGAAVIQPQIGAGYDFITNPNLGTETLESGTSYRPPKYDAFGEGSADMKVELPAAKISTAQNVDFSIRNNMPGNSDPSSASTKSTFTFMASVISNSSINGTASGEFEYRWDFNNNGKDVTYFSHLPSVNHQFKKAGNYQVKLEVLDKAGNVSQVLKYVTVVDNTPPKAMFSVDKVSAPINSIFNFDSSFSSDDQYSKYNLFYRFDWNGDGLWDTNFQSKNNWSHLYRETGSFKVVMEVMDPEGAKAKSQLMVEVTGDLPPQAALSIGNGTGSNFGLANYNFDASASSDDHTPLSKLKFRWDFNYAGKNDMVFDTAWGTSAKVSGSYRIGGSKIIRLQVMDEQGQVDEAYAKLEVSWTQQAVNRIVGVVVKQ